MPKKQFLRDTKKKSKHTPQIPATADEYLAAGVDFEEAGEKWRGGDAVKSTRFFVRAIDNYEEALKKFPNSFDLAYNRARVLYELTQYPKLRAQLPGTLLDLLSAALEASRFALSLKQDNADILFNTAQVLTSIAEVTSETRNVGNDNNLALLEEAIELFQRCLTLQEYQYTESQTQAESAPISDDDPDMEEGGVSLSNPNSEPPQDDRWASIVEPVTLETLLDTVVAQLQTLAILCGLVLTAALDNLTKASKLPSADNLPKIHILRGDVDLLRFQLGQPPSNYEVSFKNGAVLSKNAEKFYRGAGNFAKVEGLSKELEEAEVKEALAMSLYGEQDKLLRCVKLQPEVVRNILEDALDDGLISYEALSAMGIA
ncbi:hypothetical protein H4I95_05197 [Botrytis cinerea]